MILSSLPVSKPSIWRRVGSSAALAASLAFAFQPTLLLAQVRVSDPDRPVPVQPKPVSDKSATAKKSRQTPTDKVSDELNRRESERVEQMMRAIAAAPVPAVEVKPADLPTTTGASPPPRTPIITASLTPDAPTPQPQIPPIAQPSVERPPAAVPDSTPGIPPAPPALPRLTQVPPPAPVPVPIQPPAPGASPRPAPPIISGAPSRSFGQGQMVPTQQPTLSLEVNKGTAIKLPGPAATVFVAAPDIADVQVKSPGMIYVFAKKPGDTVLYAVDDQDRVLLNTIVRVTSPISRMKDALDALHPDNGVGFDNQGEAIVLSGTVRSAAIAEDARRLALQHVASNAKVINNIRINAPTQVQLQVKVAEVSRQALKRVGINWQNINNVALFGISVFGSAAAAGAALRTVQGTGGAPSGIIAFQNGDNGLNGFIDFLATQSQATVLAEPNLIAMSGETASFLAGGEIPVLTPQAGLTGSTISVIYKQIGISLAFTPTIIGDRINLKVAPEVSQLTTNGQVSVPLTATSTVIIPAIQTRKASTTIELGSGQSFAIAGLLLQTSQQDIIKLPWMGDIPILGTLFKSDAYQRNETELVIIITPYFVEPTNGKLRTPMTGRVPPTDADRLIYQRLNHPTPPNRIAVGREQQVRGPSAGFKLD